MGFTIHYRQLFFGFLTFVISFLCMWTVKSIFGWSPDFPIASLVAFSMVGGISETLVLSGFAAWLLNWESSISVEIITLIALPFIIVVTREKIFHWKHSVSVFAFSFLSILLFYFISLGADVLQVFPSLLISAGVGGAWSIAMMYVLNRVS